MSNVYFGNLCALKDKSWGKQNKKDIKLYFYDFYCGIPCTFNSYLMVSSVFEVKG